MHQTHQCITVHHGASRCITGSITGCIMVHHSASWCAKSHQAGGYTAIPLGRWHWHVSCVLCSFSTTAASYEPTLGVWAGVSPQIPKRSPDMDLYPKHIQNHIFWLISASIAIMRMRLRHGASWCIMVHHGAKCTVPVHHRPHARASYTNRLLVHHNASPVHHTVHHSVHQTGAARCIKPPGLIRPLHLTLI